MEKIVMLDGKINLATLCLYLCEEIEENSAYSRYRLKPMPKDEAFEKEIELGEEIYRALYETICGLIDIFRKENEEIVVSTYQTGIIVTGLEVAGKDLDDLCSLDNGKYLIQKSRLGIALAFLDHEQVTVEQICEGKMDCINFAFPKEAEKLYAGAASK